MRNIYIFNIYIYMKCSCNVLEFIFPTILRTLSYEANAI